MSFESKFQQHDVAASKKRAEELANELQGGSSKARVRVKDGLNVWWVLPKVGTMLEPICFKYVHYNPFHICGRKDPIPDPNDLDKLIEDRNFKNCYRDITAWNTYDKAGRPKSGPIHQKFKADMPSLQAAVQVVNLSPFFELDASKTLAIPNKDLIKKWGDTFVEVMKGAEPPEDMPEEMIEAAQAGVDVVFLNQTAGKQLRKTHISACIEEEEDLFFCPDRYLVQIIRSDGAETFVGSDGKQRKGKNYDIRFTSEKKMKNWSMPEGLMDVVVEQAIDINEIPVEGDELTDKVDALHPLSEPELIQYLESMGHSFHLTDEDGDAEDEDASGPSLSDPDAFVDNADSALSVKGKRSLADLRKQVEDE